MRLIGRSFRRRVIGTLVILLFVVGSSGLLSSLLPTFAAPNLNFKWIKSLGSNSKAFISPLAADLVGDSVPEIVIVGGTVDGGSDGTVTVLNGTTGATLRQRTFPWTVGGYTFGVGMHTCFEIADLYNDGRQKILVAAEGGLLVLNGNDLSLNWSNPAAPGRQNYFAVVDVDGDGYKEIFLNRGNAPYPGWLGYDWITMLSYDGKILRQGYSWHPCWGGLTVGDTNNDGKFEVYQGDRGNTYANSADEFKQGGQGLRALDALTLTPLWTAQNILMSSHAPMLADVDKDGIQDVVVAWQSNGIAVFNSSDGSVLTTGGKYRASSSVSGVSAHSQPTVADLDNDTNLEFVVAYNSQVVVWDLFDWKRDAILLNETGSPIEVFEPPKAGDVTGDGLLDIIAVTVSGDIYIYNQSYSLVEHVKTPGFSGGSAMTLVQDVDGDNSNELVVTGSQGVTVCYDTLAASPNPRARASNTFYSESRRGAAEYVPAPIPVSPTLNLEWPVNSATNQVLNPTLSVKVADFQQNPMSITLETNVSGTWTTIRQYSGVGNDVYNASTSNMNQYGKKYFWRVTASDGSHLTTETYEFTTLSSPPTQGTPSLVTGGFSLVASNVSTSDPNVGDSVNNVYTWYVDGVPYSNLYLPFDSRGSSNPMVTETVFSDGFETGFGNWSSGSWTRDSSQRYSGSWSARADGSSYSLTSVSIDTSAAEGLTVSFWYRDIEVDDADDVYLWFYNGSSWHRIFELGNTNPEGVWHYYSVQTFSAQFCRSDFRFRFSADAMTSGEYLWVDDVSVVVPSRTKDYSGYANDATIHGAQWTPDGVIGGAYVFDGVTDYMRIPDQSELDGDGAWTELSVEFWIKPLSWSTGDRIIAKKVAGDSTGEYMVGFQTSGSPSNTLFFGVTTTTEDYQDTWNDATTRLAPGNWYHIVGTYQSGPGLKIYVNGTLRQTKAVSGPILDLGASTSVFGSPLFIGTDGSGDQSRRYFNGLLDEIKIYNHTLSAYQVAQNYLESREGKSNQSTIVLQETQTGQTWNCRVTPNDSFGDGTTQPSNNVLVSGPLPTFYDLTVNVEGAGSTLPGAWAQSYVSGQIVGITAYPNPGWKFSGWSGDASGSVNPTTVIMTSNKTVTATFTEIFAVPFLVDSTFDASADSAALRANGAGQDWYESRGGYSGGDPTLLILDQSNVGGDVGKKAGFIASTSGNAYLSQEFAAPQAGAFTVQWNVYVDSIVDLASGTDAAAFMMIGDDSDLTRGPNSADSERFVYMACYKSGGGTSGTMTLFCRQWGTGSTRTTIATLNLDQWYTIKVLLDVPSSLYWVYVNGVKYGPFTARSDKTSVTHISFAQWNDGAGAFYVDNVTSPAGIGSVIPPPVGLVISVSPLGSGSTVPTVGTHSYAEGSMVPVSATAGSGYQFSHWLLNDSYVGSANPYVVTMDQNYNLTAVFAPIPQYGLLVEFYGSGSTNATGTTMHNNGTVVYVQASPSVGWTLSYWLLNGTNVGAVNPYAVTMTANRNLTAVFTQYVFEDGFETGNFSLWSGLTTTSGENATVVNTVSHHGVYSAVFSSNGDGGFESAYAYKSLQPMSEVFVRGYFNVSASGIDADNDRFYFMVLRAGTNSVAYAGWRRTAGTVRWSIIIRDGTGGWITAYSDLIPALNQWYSVEFHWTYHSTQGLGELFVNGLLVCSAYNRNTAALGNVDTLRFGLAEVYNCAPTAVYGDCLVVSTKYIGPESLLANIHLESFENTLASSNLGSVMLNGTLYTLPNDLSNTTGIYLAEYSAPNGYVFDHWETTGMLTLSDANTNSTMVTVLGNGSLKAMYKNDTDNIVFEDHFESGNYSKWDGTVNTSGETSSISNVLPYDGVYSASFASDGGGGFESAYAYKSLQSMSEVFVRGYFNVSASGIDADNDRFYFMVLRAGTNSVAYAGWRRTAGVVRWNLLIRNGTGWVTAFSNEIPALNQWYSVELHWVQASVNGYAELFVNGQLVCTIQNCDTATYGSVNVARFGLAELYNCANTIIYCDSCKVSKALIGTIDP